MSRPPPRIYPADLSKQFAADPFSDKMHDDGPQREHTPLGTVLEGYAWLIQYGHDDYLQPVRASFRACLVRECPKALAEVESLLGLHADSPAD